MLLSKKILHILSIVQNQQNIIRSLVFFFYVEVKKVLFIIIYLSIFNIFLKKKILPLYLYIFEIKLPNFILFNNIILKVYELLRSIDFSINFQLNFIKKKTKKITILRSPFVYKKTKEQFVFEKFKGYVFMYVGIKNIFIIEYLDFFFKSLLGFSNIFKVLLKKLIYLN
jgi:hypothetical protein